MAICRFCKQKFQSEQGVKAHMKWCAQYEIEKSKKLAALGTKPKAALTPVATLPGHAIPPVATTDFSAPLREFEQAMRDYSTKQPAPQTPQQRHRDIVQAAKTQVIDRDRTPVGQVTASMRGSAKLAIERELAPLPLEELPFEEVLEIAAAIRDGCYAPACTRQAREATRQRVEEERRHKKEVEALGAWIRADRRKKILIQQASQQALASCGEKEITGWAKLSVVGDIESRLEALMTGDEPILEAQAIVRSVLEARFAEAKATLAAARVKATERWYEEVAAALVLGAVVAAPLLAAWYPTQAVAIFKWLEQTFGLKPRAEAVTPTPETAETSPPAASAEARPPIKRRRKDPVVPPGPESPWGNALGGAPAHA
ncbi:MAG: hypothetical protein JW395_3514 [Nitrospira sp.]|nr:hypothetical protein [Nitrospira sp.]